MTVEQAFEAAMQICAADLTARAGRARQSDDPEAIHQLRVGIRRLRAVLSTFRRALPGRGLRALGRQLRAVQQALGGARDWDVLVEETIDSLPDQASSKEILRPLIGAAQARRRRGHSEARAALRSSNCTKLLSRLQTGALSNNGAGSRPARAVSKHPSASPVVGFAIEALQRRHRQARKLGRKIRDLEQRDLHQLRIRIKKLRYAVELFRDLWPVRRSREYLLELKKLQQLLGRVHDATVAGELTDELARAGGPEVKQAGPLARSQIGERAARDRKALNKRWRSFAKLDPFWQR